MKFDLKNFKKIGSDKVSTTLQNHQGHQIKVAHSALKPEHLKHLMSLPTPKEAKLPEVKSPAVKMAKGGEAKKMSDGGEAPLQVEAIKPEEQPLDISPEPTAPPPMPEAPQAAAPTPQQAPMPAAPQQAAAQPDPFGVSTQAQALERGIGEQKAGIAGEATALGAMGQAEAKQLQTQQFQQQKSIENYSNNYNEIEQDRQKLSADVANQHFDPNHYWSGKSTGGKISTVIGLILGGLGGSDAPLKFLENNINRDIDLQKAELGKKENLLSANMKRFGNLRDATDMTRIMQADRVSNLLKMEAAKAQDPLAKARAMTAAGQIDERTAPLQGQMAMRRTLLTPGNNSGITPEQRLMGLGAPPEATKELKEAQDTAKFRDNVVEAFDQLNKTNTVGNRIMHAGFTPAAVKAYRDPLLAALSKGTAGKFTDKDSDMLESLFPAPGDSTETTKIKRSQLIKLMSEKMHFPVLEQYGVHMGESSPSGGIKERPPVLKK